MIVVRLELHSALTGKVTEIGVTRIANIGGSKERSDYEARVQRRKDRPMGTTADWCGWEKNQPARVGYVRDYPRHSYNVWGLVIRALRSAFPEEV